MSTLKKEYSNDEITVIWQPDLCIHCGNCAKGLPEVFQPKEKPWIKLNNATAEKIKLQIDNCPSGALSYKVDHSKDNIMEDKKDGPLQIEVINNGPLVILGTINIKHKDGSEQLKENRCTLCRCGGSSNKPFCDGSHKQIQFE